MSKASVSGTSHAPASLAGRPYLRVELSERNDRQGRRWQLDVTQVHWDASGNHQDGAHSFTTNSDIAWICHQLSAFLAGFRAEADTPVLFNGEEMGPDVVLAAAEKLMREAEQ